MDMSHRGDRSRQFVKLRFPPGSQDHGMALARKNVGKRRADTRRRPGDQANWLGG